MLWQCAFHSFQYWGHSTETGIIPRLTLKSGYLKEDLSVVIKVLTGNWLGTKKLLSIRKQLDNIYEDLHVALSL